MPIYEYVCAGCSENFEKLTTLAEAHTVQECPKCGKTKGERVLSMATVGGSSGGTTMDSCPNAGPSCGMGGGFG